MQYLRVYVYTYTVQWLRLEATVTYSYGGGDINSIVILKFQDF